jgi:hypothetical protein
VARAKNTDRAEARRRHRAELAAAAEPDVAEEGLEGEPPAQRPSERSPTRSGGYLNSMRSAYRRPDIRADIAYLPHLLRSKAFLVPLALTVVATAIVLVAPTSNILVSLLVTLCLATPPIGSIYAAAIFAPRAAYLSGAIAGLLGAIGYVTFILSVQVPASDLEAFNAVKGSLISQALIASPIFGVLLGAGLSYYRRLLAGLNPKARRPPNGANRPAPRTGGPATRRR